MKTCEYCGSHVDNDTVYCPHCGASKFKVEEKPSNFNSSYTYSSGNTQNQNNKASSGGKGENKTLAILCIIFAFCIPIVGFIMACVGLDKYEDDSNRKLVKAGLIISIIVFALDSLTGSNLFFL